MPPRFTHQAAVCAENKPKRPEYAAPAASRAVIWRVRCECRSVAAWIGVPRLRLGATNAFRVDTNAISDNSPLLAF